MVYIFSEKSDPITDLVTEWLVNNNTDFKRFNDDDFIENSYLLSKNEAVTKVWQYRGTFKVIPDSLYDNYPNKKSILDYLQKEIREFNVYLEYILKRNLKSNYVGSFTKEVFANNKLINLDIAESVGLQVPITLVTNSKVEFVSFLKKHEKIISKDLRAPVKINIGDKRMVSNGVELVTKEMIDGLSHVFAPIFAQKYVEKKYEIRVFIFSKQLYAMAIFSQKDAKTSIDYRNHHKKQPNRCVPVLLPKHIEDKLWKFMEIADLNTGSIDIIVTPTNEYIFLEINPMGQFHWLTRNCNYHIEKNIAHFLTNERS